MSCSKLFFLKPIYVIQYELQNECVYIYILSIFMILEYSIQIYIYDKFYKIHIRNKFITLIFVLYCNDKARHGLFHLSNDQH